MLPDGGRILDSVDSFFNSNCFNNLNEIKIAIDEKADKAEIPAAQHDRARRDPGFAGPGDVVRPAEIPRRARGGD